MVWNWIMGDRGNLCPEVMVALGSPDTEYLQAELWIE